MLQNNPNFNLALEYINAGNYEKAVAKLEVCINDAIAADNVSESMQARCVLGELYANIGKKGEAIDHFTQVVKYCTDTGLLRTQGQIAAEYLKALTENKPIKKPNHIPMVEKPVQDKAFITRTMNKKRK